MSRSLLSRYSNLTDSLSQNESGIAVLGAIAGNHQPGGKPSIGTQSNSEWEVQGNLTSATSQSSHFAVAPTPEHSEVGVVFCLEVTQRAIEPSLFLSSPRIPKKVCSTP